MADKGIIFSGPMVRALLDGRKTQTRRLCKAANAAALSYVVALDDPPRPGWFGDEEGEVQFKVPYAPGDRLYVREAHYVERAGYKDGSGQFIHYRATDPDAPVHPWCPSIHMPRWASRLWLAVTDVCVQRVQDISLEDVRAEGCEIRNMWLFGLDGAGQDDVARRVFSGLWDSLHTNPGERWDDNPWIVAVTFEVKHGNIDRGKP